MFIKGARARLVFSVKKAKHTEGTLDLITIEQELILKQDRHICCGVEPHVVAVATALLNLGAHVT